MSKIYIPKAHEPSIWRVDSVGDVFVAALIVIGGPFMVAWATLF